MSFNIKEKKAADLTKKGADLKTFWQHIKGADLTNSPESGYKSTSLLDLLLSRFVIDSNVFHFKLTIAAIDAIMFSRTSVSANLTWNVQQPVPTVLVPL